MWLMLVLYNSVDNKDAKVKTSVRVDPFAGSVGIFHIYIKEVHTNVLTCHVGRQKFR